MSDNSSNCSNNAGKEHVDINCEEEAQINEETVGFSEQDLQTCIKVLDTLHYRRRLLGTKKLQRLVDIGKTIFASVTPEEKRLRRKERRNGARRFKQQCNDKLLEQTQLRKKKRKEKQVILDQLLPDAHLTSRMAIQGSVIPRNLALSEMFKPVITQAPFGGQLNDELQKQEVNEQKQQREGEEPMVEEEGQEADEMLPYSQYCHICKKKYRNVHFFYDHMCLDCGDFNYAKRNQTADLTGKVALVTGGRVKIGFRIVLRLLQAGAQVYVTSRFPKDTALRYSKEPDFDKWKTKLTIYGIDFRHIPSVASFADFFMSKVKRLDILINNAAQTIRRPPIFYSNLLQIEVQPVDQLPPDIQGLLGQDFSMSRTAVPMLLNSMAQQQQQQLLAIDTIAVPSLITREENVLYQEPHDPKLPETAPLQLKQVPIASHEHQLLTRDKQWLGCIQDPNLSISTAFSQVPVLPEDLIKDEKNFPANIIDANGEQLDLRKRNTWTMELPDTPIAEFIEVHMVNVTAPFILVSRLKPLMSQLRDENKWIVNVSSMEGQFYKGYKNTTHAHTNMAKAGLNMMTRTCGPLYAMDHIFMNSVDTGWVTDENPKRSVQQLLHDQKTEPLDEDDGAARVLDPIFVGVNTGFNSHSQFYKDYRSVLW